ncbi:EamA family transporter [Halococcus saccharolyticus]|uniref:Dmt(Drug/metabolite transporter) superfamily permease n=1 Tax=Halococcus saccharolyticus DSM 5350 TaxID=1227455 RepID=M0MQE3_9EURY|nr:dmt(drug/metabolite transporter) superfamily permease [Halococcus saccharolyticus DSM 5350]
MFGFVTYLELIGEVGALKASLTTRLTPIAVLAVGWLLLDERIQPVALIGFGIIVAGFVLLESRDITAELAKYRSQFP